MTPQTPRLSWSAFLRRGAGRALRTATTCGALALLLLLAGPALAQLGGFPGMTPRRPIGQDWGISPQSATNVRLIDLKKAYRGGIQDLNAGECRTATTKFEFVLDHIKNDPDLHFVAATAHRCMKNFLGAADQYERVLELDEDYYPAYRFLGISLLATGHFDESVELFSTLETKRQECDPKCDEALEGAYAELRKALDYIKKTQDAASSS